MTAHYHLFSAICVISYLLLIESSRRQRTQCFYLFLFVFYFNRRVYQSQRRKLGKTIALSCTCTKIFIVFHNLT